MKRGHARRLIARGPPKYDATLLPSQSKKTPSLAFVDAKQHWGSVMFTAASLGERVSELLTPILV